jgi:hypothetical protein
MALFPMSCVLRDFLPSTYFKYAEDKKSMPRHSLSDGGLCGRAHQKKPSFINWKLNNDYIRTDPGSRAEFIKPL